VLTITYQQVQLPRPVSITAPFSPLPSHSLPPRVAVTTGITFGCATLISVLSTVKTTYTPTPARTIGIYAALLISQALLNTLGVRLLKYFNNASILLHSLGVTAFAIAVVAKAPTHQSARFVFATFYDGTGVDGAVGWSERASPAYVAVCGLLMAQYTITGFDASAHLSEETRDAARSAPRGVLLSIGVSFSFGFFLILCLLFSIQDFQSTIGSSYGQPVLQILVDVFGEDGAVVLFTLVIMCKSSHSSSTRQFRAKSMVLAGRYCET